MKITLKLYNETIYPNGEWRNIAHELDRNLFNDDDIYFYVDNNFDLKNIHINDIVELDEKFVVIDIEE